MTSHPPRDPGRDGPAGQPRSHSARFGASGAGPSTGKPDGGGRTTLAVIAGLVVFALSCGIELTVVGALVGVRPGESKSASGERAEWAGPVDQPTDPTTEPPVPATGPGATTSPTSKVETRTVTETAKIPFSARTVEDSSLPQGQHVVRTRGVPGVRTLTYEVTWTDGVPTGKRLIRSVVTKKPVSQVTVVGTKPESECDPNYSGCVPIARDVDCAGSRGEGPFVTGPVRVIGIDIYHLDRNRNGIGCDE